MYAISLVSRFMEKSFSNHWETKKRILRYVDGTLDYGIFYQANMSINLVGYSDSDLVGSVDDNISTSNYIFDLAGGEIAWCSINHPTIALYHKTNAFLLLR